MAERNLEFLFFPKGLQGVKDALAGTFAEQGRCNVAFFAQIAGAFQEDKVVDVSFLYDFSFYSRQFIGFLKENIHVAFGILVEVFVNGKRAAVYAIFAAL